MYLGYYVWGLLNLYSLSFVYDILALSDLRNDVSRYVYSTRTHYMGYLCKALIAARALLRLDRSEGRLARVVVLLIS